MSECYLNGTKIEKQLLVKNKPNIGKNRLKSFITPGVRDESQNRLPVSNSANLASIRKAGSVWR